MKNSIVLLLALGILTSCSNDNDSVTEVEKGSFSYSVSGAASKTVTGDKARFGSTGSFDQTFITLILDSDELDIRIVLDPITPGTYKVNPMVVKDGGGQITNIPIATLDSWADLGIGSTLAGDRRSFSTGSANGGSVTITKADVDVLQGTIDVSMMELLSGGVFDNPKITVKGSFTAIKQ